MTYLNLRRFFLYGFSKVQNSYLLVIIFKFFQLLGLYIIFLSFVFLRFLTCIFWLIFRHLLSRFEFELRYNVFFDAYIISSLDCYNTSFVFTKTFLKYRNANSLIDFFVLTSNEILNFSNKFYLIFLFDSFVYRFSSFFAFIFGIFLNSNNIQYNYLSNYAPWQFFFRKSGIKKNFFLEYTTIPLWDNFKFYFVSQNSFLYQFSFLESCLYLFWFSSHFFFFFCRQFLFNFFFVKISLDFILFIVYFLWNLFVYLVEKQKFDHILPEFMSLNYFLFDLNFFQKKIFEYTLLNNLKNQFWFYYHILNVNYMKLSYTAYTMSFNNYTFKKYFKSHIKSRWVFRRLFEFPLFFKKKPIYFLTSMVERIGRRSGFYLWNKFSYSLLFYLNKWLKRMFIYVPFKSFIRLKSFVMPLFFFYVQRKKLKIINRLRLFIDVLRKLFIERIRFTFNDNIIMSLKQFIVSNLSYSFFKKYFKTNNLSSDANTSKFFNMFFLDIILKNFFKKKKKKNFRLYYMDLFYFQKKLNLFFTSVLLLKNCEKLFQKRLC